MVDDPFGNTDLKDAKIVTVNNAHPISITLPSLGEGYSFKGINSGNTLSGKAEGNTIEVTPGVYLLGKDAATLANAEKVEKVAGNIALTEYVSPDADSMPFTLLAPMRSDPALDVNMIPEAWTFRFDRRPTNWDETPVYELTSSPDKDGVIVARRYVADKIARIPEGINPKDINVKFQHQSGDVTATPLPSGTELAIVTAEGFTYSVPVNLDADGMFSAKIQDLMPRKGIIMPTPYPVTVTRESPASTEPVKGFRDIQFVELIIPQKAGEQQTLLPERIWIE